VQLVELGLRFSVFGFRVSASIVGHLANGFQCFLWIWVLVCVRGEKKYSTIS